MGSVRAKILAASFALVALLGAAYFAYTVGRGSGYETGSEAGYEAGFREGVKTEAEAPYRLPVADPLPSLDIDMDAVLEALVAADTAGPNPAGPDPAFGAAIDQTHRAMLEELVRIYGLSDGEKAVAFEEYESLRDDVVTSYFDDLRSLDRARQELPSETFIDFKSYEAASDFATVLGDHSCLAFSTLMAFSSVKTEAKYLLKGLCKVVAYDLLLPFSNELRDRALVVDLEATRLDLREHLRTSIAELAVAEDRLSTTFDRTFVRTILPGTWFESESSATLTIAANGAIKAGFDLQDYFELTLDHDAKVLIVTLPQPSVLSRDVSFEVLNDVDGFFVKITPEKRTAALGQIRRDLERMALERGLLGQARSRAENLVQVLYSPITYLPGSSYGVEVRFQGDLRIEEDRG